MAGQSSNVQFNTKLEANYWDIYWLIDWVQVKSIWYSKPWKSPNTGSHLEIKKLNFLSAQIMFTSLLVIKSEPAGRTCSIQTPPQQNKGPIQRRSQQQSRLLLHFSLTTASSSTGSHPHPSSRYKVLVEGTSCQKALHSTSQALGLEGITSNNCNLWESSGTYQWESHPENAAATVHSNQPVKDINAMRITAHQLP